MPIISIKHASGDLAACLEEALDPFRKHVSLAGKSVLIKPNLVEPVPFTSGQTTNPALVEAILLWCKQQGAQRVAIGEGPSYFQPQSALRDCFTKTGMADVACRQSVPWILFDEHAFRTYREHSDRTPAEFAISEHAFSWDAIINVPVPKTHYLAGISNAMKNLKGFVRRADKPLFHFCGQDHLHGSITELNLLIRPLLNIVDCTAPGQWQQTCILAGTDIVATDSVAASLMNINPETIGTIRFGHQAGLGEKDVAKIEIIGDDLRGFRMNFEQPAQYLQRVFPGLSIDATAACSGCMLPLFKALRCIEAESGSSERRARIVCGRQAINHSADGVILIGHCAQHLTAGPWLGGCPPEQAEILAFLKQHL